MEAVDAPTLEWTWKVQASHDPTEHPPDAGRLVQAAEPCLRALEHAGHRAFNIYPSHYEPPLAAPVLEAVNRLRSLGATCGIACDRTEGVPARVEVSVSARDRADEFISG